MIQFQNILNKIQIRKKAIEIKYIFYNETDEFSTHVDAIRENKRPELLPINEVHAQADMHANWRVKLKKGDLFLQPFIHKKNETFDKISCTPEVFMYVSIHKIH